MPQKPDPIPLKLDLTIIWMAIILAILIFWFAAFYFLVEAANQAAECIRETHQAIREECLE